jgi:hypothetical protein
MQFSYMYVAYQLRTKWSVVKNTILEKSTKKFIHHQIGAMT